MMFQAGLEPGPELHGDRPARGGDQTEGLDHPRSVGHGKRIQVRHKRFSDIKRSLI